MLSANGNGPFSAWQIPRGEAKKTAYIPLKPTTTKYIYIAGLEHSGTTLLAQLLSSQEEVLAIGEAGQFLLEAHMSQYLAKWGQFPDVTRCSCGKEWSDCPLWSRLMHLKGKFDESNLSNGYRQLISQLTNAGSESIIVDTSKSFEHLESLMRAWRLSERSLQDLVVLVVVKDPRGFAWSINRKEEQRHSLLATIRTMNWWNSVYRRLANFSVSSDVPMAFATYEQICKHPKYVLQTLGRLLGQALKLDTDISHQNSHIALGNKNFIERNRARITYDDAWKSNRQVKVAYALNVSVRNTWRMIKKAASAGVAIDSKT